ncbi:MAG: hypothetical protein AB7F22_29295 [Reyranella sp.]|uniref:hypothetical protein n=1 Tax=Reyranella sp. TaxID=1929291 RepID=UPI003D146E4E
MRPVSLVRMARAGWAEMLGVAPAALLVAVLSSCARVDRHVTVYQTDDRGGLYPAGPLSGEPTYHVGWRIYR